MKQWQDMTINEIRKITEKQCQHCQYARMPTGGSDASYIVCLYILEEKKRRGCSPINCKKFKPRKGRKNECL